MLRIACLSCGSADTLAYSTPMSKMNMEDTIPLMMTRFMTAFLTLDIQTGYARLPVTHWVFI